jgi:hypothetical protein
MSNSQSDGATVRVRDWAEDNQWTVRFLVLEAVLVVGAFVIAAFGGPPSSGVNREPTLRVIAGMMLVYAGVLAIVAALLYIGYAAVGRLQQDSITAQ